MKYDRIRFLTGNHYNSLIMIIMNPIISSFSAGVSPLSSSSSISSCLSFSSSSVSISVLSCTINVSTHRVGSSSSSSADYGWGEGRWGGRWWVWCGGGEGRWEGGPGYYWRWWWGWLGPPRIRTTDPLDKKGLRKSQKLPLSKETLS